MPIKITLAKKTEQIDAILKLRHQEFSAKNLSDEGRSLNRFDAYPTTSHLIVEENGKVVGGLRLCLNSAVGMPLKVSTQFLEKLPPHHKIMCCDQYCVSESFHNAKIARGLLLMASYYAAAHYQATHLITQINPAIVQIKHKLEILHLEAQELQTQSPQTQSAQTTLLSQPVIFEIAALKDPFTEFVKNNQLESFLGSFECVFYEEGDYIIRAGERGDCAYILVEGEANVIHPHKYRMVNILKPGDIFGEIALLEVGLRTANVVAKKPLRVMRLYKTAFMDYLLDNPEKAIAMMSRINEQIKKTSD